MKMNKGLVLSLMLFLSTAFAANTEFPDYGFSINSFDTKPIRLGSQSLVMYLPIKNSFAANVNVQIQPFSGPISQYIELSVSQFKQAGLEAFASELEGEKALFEYKGSYQGSTLRWYARAIKKEDFVYLVTATDLEENWENNKKKLKSMVDSFELTR